MPSCLTEPLPLPQQQRFLKIPYLTEPPLLPAAPQSDNAGTTAEPPPSNAPSENGTEIVVYEAPEDGTVISEQPKPKSKKELEKELAEAKAEAKLQRRNSATELSKTAYAEFNANAAADRATCNSRKTAVKCPGVADLPTEETIRAAM